MAASLNSCHFDDILLASIFKRVNSKVNQLILSLKILFLAIFPLVNIISLFSPLNYSNVFVI